MNPWIGLKGLPREMWIVSFAILINRMGTMVLPFLVIYLTDRMGLKISTAGFVVTFYGLGALITAPFVGKLADKVGSFFLMKVSLFCTSVLLVLYPFISTYSLILIVTFVWAVISEAFRPASMALVSSIVKPGQRKTAFALNRLMINLGMSIGPVAAGFLIKLSFSIIFFVDAFTSFLAALFLVFFPVKIIDSSIHESTGADSTGDQSPAWKDKHFIYFLLALIPASFVIFQHIGSMPVFLIKDLHFDTGTVGLLFAVNTILIILVEVPLNTAISDWSYGKTLMLGSLLIAVGFGAMAFTSNIFYIIISIIVWTFGEMTFFPIGSAYVAEVAPGNRRGEYMGFYQMIFSLSFTLAPWLGTTALENFGAKTLWIGAFFTASVSAMLMLRLKEHRFSSETVSVD